MEHRWGIFIAGFFSSALNVFFPAVLVVFFLMSELGIAREGMGPLVALACALAAALSLQGLLERGGRIFARAPRARGRAAPRQAPSTPRSPAAAVARVPGGGSAPAVPDEVDWQAEIDACAASMNAHTIVQAGGQLPARLAAATAVARYHGVDPDPREARADTAGAAPTGGLLVEWFRRSGLWAKSVKLSFRQLMKIDSPAPILLLLTNGDAALVVGRDREHGVLLVRDPLAPTHEPPMAVTELRLKQVWDGETVLVRASRAGNTDEEPFDLGLLTRLVWGEKSILRDVAIGSITITILSVLPVLMIMTTLNTVVIYKSFNTLTLIVVVLVIALIFEMLITWSRRMLLVVLACRLDTRLNLAIFDRLMTLPIDFFERNQAGELSYKIAQFYRVRDFLTGRLMTTFIDVAMVALLLPVLFYMEATLAWTVLVAAGCITLVIAAFLRPLARMTAKLVQAESNKGSTLVESIYGIRTIKSLGLEPTRAAEWDQRVAELGELNLQMGKLSNWPMVLVMPFEKYTVAGVLALGAFIALNSDNPLSLGGLIGFMMLGGRVAGPLVSLARLLQDVQEARQALSQVGWVLNRPTEKRALTNGLRPRFYGAISFEDVTFTYEGTKQPALDKVSFAIEPGSMLGLVGRSGSGKSTITRLLMGINRDYSGSVKIDGTDLREINLRYLRQSFGVVLQDNFLFRGTVKDNILAGRPGLTFEDVVRAARLAGAEEFIERLPQGYETLIQEGSPNLSGGQRQRLAIARALIVDPRLLILDEATSSLDPESEALINANLQRMAAGRTMVIVSHRLSSLVDCDQTLVLDRGKVLDIGPHRELVERCAVYRHLWMQQNRHMDPQGKAHVAPAPKLSQRG
ncbi:HlyB family type I secretion system ABC transporter [Angulomicrobium tetraedrale]|uniref:HlyB family type I secretion system ABC transporter n=1 Tax=Ancylobacter tetraedralis TaxID=217068 RepID=A0A839ZB33_9HYPH|nr:peptidase domain-containing ABC transporter [Ancylobacter tetraedralis]MBB3771983.1 HlyB family type I secretion system ABC transporter [Ancylobacter tetraedralis]